MRAVLAALATLTIPTIVSAQASPVPPPPPGGAVNVQGSVTIGTSTGPQPVAQSGTLAPIQVVASPCPPSSDALYNEALNRLAAGDDAAAAVLFGRVLEMCPTHPTAADMRRNAEQHARAGGAQSVAVSVQPAGAISAQVANGAGFLAPIPTYNLVYGPDTPSVAARVQLVTGQALFGGTIGTLLALMPSAGPDPAHIAAGFLLGTGVGVTASILASMNGVTTGQAIAVNYGSGMGLALGASVAILAGTAGSLSFTAVMGLLAGGAALGTGAGALVAALARPVGGKMAYTASLTGWTTLAATHIFMGVGGFRSLGSASATGYTIGGLLLGGLVGGGALGAATAPLVHVSADRMGWINLATSTGYAVVGLSAGLFALSAGGFDYAFGWGGLVGAGLGALVGALVTRGTDNYWHEGRQRQVQQHDTVSPAPPPGVPNETPAGASTAGRSRRVERASYAPTGVMVSPGGGGGQSPMGLTISGAF